MTKENERKGKWEDCKDIARCRCSECGHKTPWMSSMMGFREWLSKYCPNCGARMQ